MQARGQLLGLARKNPAIGMVRPNGLDDEPQYQLDIDWEKASALGLSIADINDTLGAGWGSSYVNQFVDRGRVKKVFMQGDAPLAHAAAGPRPLVRAQRRGPHGAVLDLRHRRTGAYGSPKLERYNGTPVARIPGRARARQEHRRGAWTRWRRRSAKLPKGIGYEWTGLSYEERRSGSQAPALYAISLIVVFLCLAALYESWSIPFAVMLVVPLGIIGTVAATLLRGLANDVFFQVGLLTTVGLVGQERDPDRRVRRRKTTTDGMQLIEATVAAARQRLRPILMTSMAFILGVLPLAIATGAGAGGPHRHRHRRDRRHAHGHGARGLLRAGVLREGALGVRDRARHAEPARRRSPRHGPAGELSDEACRRT